MWLCSKFAHDGIFIVFGLKTKQIVGLFTHAGGSRGGHARGFFWELAIASCNNTRSFAHTTTENENLYLRSIISRFQLFQMHAY
jgi:hypothetical protein